MGLRIKMVEIDGEKRVPPECMRILLEFAGHRDVCDACGKAFKNASMDYCTTGMEILRELAKQPEVEGI